MERKFAFLLMGPHYDPEMHRAEFKTARGTTLAVTARNFEEACETVKRLEQEGVGAIEVCGAFGEEKTKKLIELTGNRVAIGYVTHFPEQDPLFDAFFGA